MIRIADRSALRNVLLRMGIRMKGRNERKYQSVEGMLI